MKSSRSRRWCPQRSARPQRAGHQGAARRGTRDAAFRSGISRQGGAMTADSRSGYSGRGYWVGRRSRISPGVRTASGYCCHGLCLRVALSACIVSTGSAMPTWDSWRRGRAGVRRGRPSWSSRLPHSRPQQGSSPLVGAMRTRSGESSTGRRWICNGFHRSEAQQPTAAQAAAVQGCGRCSGLGTSSVSCAAAPGAPASSPEPSMYCNSVRHSQVERPTAGFTVIGSSECQLPGVFHYSP